MTKLSRYDHSWEDPGAFRVAEGVFRIPLPLPNDALRAVNVYAIVGERSLTLIDGGQHVVAARQRLESSLALIGAAIGDISEFLVTHIHRDHYTQAIAIREEFGTRVNLGALEHPALDLIHSELRRREDRQRPLLIACGARELADHTDSWDPEEETSRLLFQYPDAWLSDGDEIRVGGRTLRVISTPGHTQGHVVFFDADDGVLFAGDHVLPHITPSIGLEPVRAKLPLGDYLGSLYKVRQLQDSRLLPAHGPVVESLHGRIDELLAHHDLRLADAYQAVVSGNSTAYEVARKLRWTSRGRDFLDLDLFNQVLAVFESKYHLDLLSFRGQLDASLEDEVVRYSVGTVAMVPE